MALFKKILTAIVERELTEKSVVAGTLADSLVPSFVAYASELNQDDLHALATELAGDTISTGKTREMLVDNARANFDRHIRAIPIEELKTEIVKLHTLYNKFPWTIPPHPVHGAVPIIPPPDIPDVRWCGEGLAPIALA